MTTVLRGVRELTEDDVDAIIDLATLCEIAENGEPDSELVEWIRSGATQQLLRGFGVDDDAGLAGFSYVECLEGRSALEVEVRVRPGLDLDLGTPLLAAARAAARDYEPTKPVHVFTNSAATRQRSWLQRQGATEVRHFWRMAIELDHGDRHVPTPPAGVVVRPARDEDADLRQIFAVVDTAFDDHFGHTEDRTFDSWISWWRSRTGYDLTLWWVAELDRRPVAALLGLPFTDTGHVATLGTLREARGRGIGTHLLRLAFAEFRARGYHKVTLGVDSENGTGAVRLYESVGMRAVNDWPLYELPPLPPLPPLPSELRGRRGR